MKRDDFILNDGQTILFIGDSITARGRSDEPDTRSIGYVGLFHDMIVARHPQRRIEVINKGKGGNRVCQLRERWDGDVMAQKFDVLSVKIGINDCNSSLNGTTPVVHPEQFREDYDYILSTTREKFGDFPLLLIDPFFLRTKETVDDDYQLKVLEHLPKYLETVEDMGKKYDARRVHTQEIFMKHLAVRSADFYAPEPVHPYTLGHIVLAEAVYDALSG